MAVLNAGSLGCNPLDKLALILLTGHPGWFEICEDDRIRAKNGIHFHLLPNQFVYKVSSNFESSDTNRRVGCRQAERCNRNHINSGVISEEWKGRGSVIILLTNPVYTLLDKDREG